MPLTPIDVQQKTFGTALRGYDLDEVDDFLDEIVTSLKDYEQRLRDAQERISTLESEMSNRGDAEGAISRALVAAQRSADAIVDEARTEAERVVAEARSQAEEIVVQRERELEDAQGEVDRLRGVVDELRRRVRTLADDLDESIGEMSQAIDEAEASLATPAPVEAKPVSDPEPVSEPESPWQPSPAPQAEWHAEPSQAEWQPEEPEAEPEPAPAYQPFYGDAQTSGRHSSRGWESADDAAIDESGALQPLSYGAEAADHDDEPGEDSPDHDTGYERVTRPWEEG
jgi:cell division initiation protein